MQKTIYTLLNAVKKTNVSRHVKLVPMCTSPIKDFSRLCKNPRFKNTKYCWLHFQKKPRKDSLPPPPNTGC